MTCSTVTGVKCD